MAVPKRRKLVVVRKRKKQKRDVLKTKQKLVPIDAKSGVKEKSEEIIVSLNSLFNNNYK